MVCLAGRDKMGSLAERSLRGLVSLMDAWAPGLLGVELSELVDA